MTLFIRTPNRIVAISDAYVMALAFIISFTVTKVVKAVIEKQRQKNKTKKINVANPRGGTHGVEFTDDTELAGAIKYAHFKARI